MLPVMVRRKRVCVGAAVVAAAGWTQGHDAGACGLFGARGIPRIGVEEALIVFDPAAGREHFIREIRFRSADESFAFVVPVPSAPEVARVDSRVFDHLRSDWSFKRVNDPAPSSYHAPGGDWGELGLGAIGTIGHGAGTGGGSGRGVSVVSQERIGRFSVAVLKGADPDALGGWLKEQKFSSSRVSRAWLSVYARLGFHFVAFRHEKPAREDPSEMLSETVRISFPTPQPYYPYREPDPPEGGVASLDRGLRVWLISPSPYRPVAVHDEEGQRFFKRPWEEGMRADAARGALRDPYLASLLPPRERFWVQTFVDLKISRRNWGDTVLVPDAPETYSDDDRARRRPLLGALLEAPKTDAPEGGKAR
jgi:hypothetical protein